MNYSHIPRHLQPVRIPAIKLERKRDHSGITRYSFFLLFILGASFIEKARKKQKSSAFSLEEAW